MKTLLVMCTMAWSGLALAADAPTAASAAADGKTGAQRWLFSVALDGKPIGSHHFSLQTDGAQRTLVSEASFNVKFLGFSAYTYQHKATEHWRGDCLTALTSTTNDDGKALRVKAQQAGDSFQVIAPKPLTVSGCVTSYAYWNPAMLKQTRLLNAQTGAIDTVQISNAGSGTFDVRGHPVSATRWRIQGPEQPIDVWVSPQGDWVGLDASVSGGRKLSYRLDAAATPLH